MAQDPRGGEEEPRAQVELQQEGRQQENKMCTDLKVCVGWVAGGQQGFCIIFSINLKTSSQFER